MEYVNLGRTGLKVSQFCLGTTNFGVVTEEEDSHHIMDAAFDAGINFLDTADAYGYSKGKGKTEEIIGRWLQKNPAKRNRVVLATKVFTPMTDDINDRGLSAYHIKRACEDSLRRLQVDHIDLYQMHHIDRSTPWEEIWQAMEQLVREGKISYVGSSNFAAWNIAQANEIAKSRHFLGLVSEQSVYNLRARTVELEVLPVCKAYGLAFIPYSPVSGGMLAGVLDQPSGGRSDNRRELIEKLRPQLEQYEALCKELGHHPADVALAWVRQQSGVTAPIIGPRTMAHLEGNLNTLDIDFDEDTLAKLDEIWPGPGNQAPEAYAW
ncbi:MAG: aldo/keto reductase [Anaerolineales bacterium]|nr:aldo/keto reductase [Anaerolineales bacterium]